MADTNVEVIAINDAKPEVEGPVVPHERQVMSAVIALWKEDPAYETLGIPKLHALVKVRHQNWTVSEKRLKSVLKQFGLLPNSVDLQFTYANEIKSEMTPDLELPEKVQIVMTKKRGKGLYAKKKLAKGELIWEESQLFFVPPLVNINLVKLGKACAYCTKLLAAEGKAVLRGLDCNVCSEVWCSHTCKKADFMHARLKHDVYNPTRKKNEIINAGAFLDLQEYCLTERWNALYAVTLIQASILLDKTGTKGNYFRAMARVSQDIRYKALNSSAGSFDSFGGGALFVQEQQESLWKEGFERFLRVFPKLASSIDYKEFLYMIGTYNINNLDSSVYLTQSHLNHTCDPNTSVETSLTSRTQGLKVYAARDIRDGEELTTTYVNPQHTVQQRQRELRVNWGFICGCPKCKEDIKEQHRRKSSTVKPTDVTSEIRNMLHETAIQVGDEGIELVVPEGNGERRKSVRFDEKVIAVKE